MYKKVDLDPFCNGTMYMYWTQRNCERCVKHVVRCVDYRCAIQRDIETRMFSNEPIAQRVIDICRLDDCPFRKEHYTYRKRKRDKAIGVLSLF